MKREQILCLAGGAILLLGALVIGFSRSVPTTERGSARNNTAATETHGFRGKSQPRTAGSTLAPRIATTSGPNQELDSTGDPEQCPEFFASLVEEARPVLAEQLGEAVTRSHRRIVDRELAAMKHDGQLTDAQAESLRRQLTERFATMVAADVDAVNDGVDAVSDVWNDSLARADEWAAETREAARKMTLVDQ